MEEKSKPNIIVIVVCVLFLGAIIVAIATPSLKLPRTHTNEVAAMGNLRTIALAQAGYHHDYSRYAKTLNEMGSGKKPVLDDSKLVNASYINKNASSYTPKSGYYYRMYTEGKKGFSIIAYPEVHGETGRYTYFLDIKGSMRSSDEKDLHLRLNSVKDLGQVKWVIEK